MVSGMYIYRLTIKIGFVQTVKMTLLKQGGDVSLYICKEFQDNIQSSGCIISGNIRSST